ncbi:MAG TPA: hypothetical protein VMV20_03820, partial [Chitinophagaceae bacterium]|nr:hypothetical protein [Chitinophagaceae bacterium]
MKRNPVDLRWLMTGVLILGSFLGTGPVYGQSSSGTPARRSMEARARELVLHKPTTIFDTSASLVINRIEDINSTMTEMNEVVASGFDTAAIFKLLPSVEHSVQMIAYNITNRSGGMNLRSLSMVDNMLDEDVQELKDWQSSLFVYSTELVSFTVQIRAMTHDS